MRRISSRNTLLYKRFFPVFWFGFLGFFLAFLLLLALTTKGGVPLPMILFPLAMAAFGYFLMKKLMFDLVDEVWDGGDVLIVRNKGQEEHIPLSAIVNVSYTTFVNPARVTLILREGGVPGREVTFCPLAKLSPFSKNPIIRELIEKIDKARLAR